MPSCPHHPAVALEAKKRGWYCEECGRNILDYEPDESVRVRDFGVDPERLPSIIAIPVAAYCRETQPFLALLHICDTAELLLRLIVAIAIADIRRAHHGELPEALRSEMNASRINTPTLGDWQRMAGVLARCVSRDSVVPELTAFVTTTLEPLLGGEEEATVETSLLALRNRLAHGAGMRASIASRLLALHAPRFEEALREATWLRAIELVAIGDDGQPGTLAGPSPVLRAASAPVAPGIEIGPGMRDAVFLVRGRAALSLWPFIFYGVPSSSENESAFARIPVPQVYARRGTMRLLLTPIGSDEIAQSEAGERAHEAFTGIFTRGSKKPKKWDVADFETDLLEDAAQRIGREAELAQIRKAVAETAEGVLWIGGPAGIGKSILTAQVAVDLLAAAQMNEIILPYRFKEGDARCSREAFLRFACERLRERLKAVAPGDGGQRLTKGQTPIEELRKLLGQLRGHRITFVLDGLDEIAASDDAFAEDVPLGVAREGLLWLCTGRPERGLSEAFSSRRCQRLFLGRLPDMKAYDIRKMLLESIGPLRKRLLRKDSDAGDAVLNPFVDAVVAHARGLPIYVRYVIQDIHNGRIRTFDESLPPSLADYHDELLTRYAAGSLHQVVTPLLCTLATAKASLGPDELQALMVCRTIVPDSEEGRVLVRTGLAAIAGVLQRQSHSDGEREGLKLFHFSLRNHVEHGQRTHVAMRTAREAMCAAALDWERIGDGAAGSYLYDYGVAHLLELQRVGDASALLTSFPYLMARLAAATKTDVKHSVDRLLNDYAAVHGMAATLDDDGRARLEKWQLHVSRFANLLQRGTPAWGAHRILHQVTADRDESDIAAEAYRWSARLGDPPLQRMRSSREVAPRGLVRVLDTGSVVAVLEIGEGRVISATREGFLQVWDAWTGRGEAFWKTSGDLIGAVILAEDCIATCDRAGAVRLWRLTDRSQIATYVVPVGDASCVAALPAIGQLVIGETEGQLHLVDPIETRSSVLISHEHSSRIESITVFGGLRFATVSYKNMVRLLRSPRSALPASARDGRSLSDTGVKKVGDGRWQVHFLEWQLFCWDLQNGDAQLFTGDDGETNGLVVIPDGTIATSSSWDASIQLHLPSGTTTLLKGHEDRITCAASLEGGRVATGSKDGTIRIWSTAGGEPLGVLQSTQEVRQLTPLKDGRLLQWGRDQATVRIWDPTQAAVDPISPPARVIAGVVVLSDGRLVTYGYEGAIVIWDGSGRTPLVRLDGHSDFVRQVHELGTRRLLSSSWDGSVRIWDTESGRQVNAIEGLGKMEGAMMVKPNVIVAWNGGTLVRWRLGEGWRSMLHRKQEVHEISLPPSEAICTLLPLPGGLIAANCLIEIDLWDVEKERIVHRIEADNAIFAPAFVVLGTGQLATMCEGRLQLWSIESGAMMASWDVGTRNETIWRMLALPDGSIAILSMESGVHVCDANTGRRRSQFPLPGSMNPTGVFLCGDRHLGVFDADAGIIQIHEMATGRLAARSDDAAAITQVAAAQSAGALRQLVVVGTSPRPIVLQCSLE